MQVHFGLGRLEAEWTGAVTCIGTFDGFHLGHRAVANRAIQLARARALPAILVTFDRHPASVLNPARVPPYLLSLEQSLNCAKDLGFDVVIILAFDAALSRMSADEFLHQILVRSLSAKLVVVGHDFAMGNGREGTASWLADRIQTEIVEAIEHDHERISSTRIRKMIQRGEIEAANNLLGRPFRIDGVVVRGQALGRTLGFPTINLARSMSQVLPMDGVYAARAQTVEGVYNAALAIGLRPAVDGQSRTIEAFLIDYPGTEIYGTSVGMDILSFVREEQDFPDLAALTMAMRADVEEIRHRLAGRSA
jgi:riboflavin kinase/FMN adenylyltransferase